MRLSQYFKLKKKRKERKWEKTKRKVYFVNQDAICTAAEADPCILGLI
jgi:hypothetical protein